MVIIKEMTIGVVLSLIESVATDVIDLINKGLLLSVAASLSMVVKLERLFEVFSVSLIMVAMGLKRFANFWDVQTLYVFLLEIPHITLIIRIISS